MPGIGQGIGFGIKGDAGLCQHDLRMTSWIYFKGGNNKNIKENNMKLFKSFVFVTAFSLVSGFFAACSDNSSSSSGNDSVEVDSYLSKIQGSYIELFPEMEKEEYRGIWINEIQKIHPDMSKEEANASTEMIIGMMEGDIIGEEAAAKYDMSTGDYAFNCYFLHKVAKFTVEGNIISGVDKNGKQVFSHNYSLVKEVNDSFFERLYKSDDENSGEFTYFIFTGDTPEETFHLEFRYGSTDEKIGFDGFNTGSYAYWMAAAIRADYDDKVMDNVIRLFVDENLGGEKE